MDGSACQSEFILFLFATFFWQEQHLIGILDFLTSYSNTLNLYIVDLGIMDIKNIDNIINLMHIKYITGDLFQRRIFCNKTIKFSYKKRLRESHMIGIILMT